MLSRELAGVENAEWLDSLQDTQRSLFRTGVDFTHGVHELVHTPEYLIGHFFLYTLNTLYTVNVLHILHIPLYLSGMFALCAFASVCICR